MLMMWHTLTSEEASWPFSWNFLFKPPLFSFVEPLSFKSMTPVIQLVVFYKLNSEIRIIAYLVLCRWQSCASKSVDFTISSLYLSLKSRTLMFRHVIMGLPTAFTATQNWLNVLSNHSSCLLKYLLAMLARGLLSR